jgi:lipoprotein-anchoring transpeptidase ErfK/SrfK
MWKWGTTTGLKTLSLLYLLSASAFGLAAALQAQFPWAVQGREIVVNAGPVLHSAAHTANEAAVKPATAWVLRTKDSIAAWFAPPQIAKAPAPKKIAAAKPPAVAPKAAPQPAMELAQPEAATPPETAELPLEPAPDANPPSPGEISRVLTHLKTGLTQELFDNFSLFLFISKAEHGPWQQRMFVFAKQESGNLAQLYSFPVSTGREVLMQGPSGQMYRTDTAAGYFQLDPERIYRRYHSSEWDHAMPYAMFFSWEHDGIQTGLAIHSAVDDDIAQLGKRASAGCVRLHPQNAHLLFNLIKKNYRGLAPRFAYDWRTSTMSNNGFLMHDQSGKVQYAEGYKVLILIENTGGDDVIAALF